MADGGEFTVRCDECGGIDHAVAVCPVRAMIERDAEIRRLREQRQRTEPAPTPGNLGAAVLAAIEAAREVATASDEDIREMEIRLAREARSERILRSGITDPGPLPDEDRRMILSESCKQTRALATVRAWLPKALRAADPDRNMLILAGPRGTGKTVAAAWALAQTGGRYVTLEEYLRDYSRWQRDRTREDGTSRELQRYDAGGLLVIDELRGELDRWLAEAERPGWHRIVDRRQSRRKHLTIGITNLSRSEFIADLQNGALDPRTYDRMKRSAYIVGIEGESMRGGSL